ncbi:protein of unknown function [Burkholderia multivorans]
MRENKVKWLYISVTQGASSLIRHKDKFTR